jgi:hypothetical protein
VVPASLDIRPRVAHSRAAGQVKHRIRVPQGIADLGVTIHEVSGEHPEPLAQAGPTGIFERAAVDSDHVGAGVQQGAYEQLADEPSGSSDDDAHRTSICAPRGCPLAGVRACTGGRPYPDRVASHGRGPTLDNRHWRGRLA